MTIRFWDTEGLENVKVVINNQDVIAKIREGIVTEMLLSPTFTPWHFAVRASKEVWEKFLLPKPPPLYNALFPGMIRQIFHLSKQPSGKLGDVADIANAVCSLPMTAVGS